MYESLVTHYSNLSILQINVNNLNINYYKSETLSIHRKQYKINAYPLIQIIKWLLCSDHFLVFRKMA